MWSSDERLVQPVTSLYVYKKLQAVMIVRS